MHIHLATGNKVYYPCFAAAKEDFYVIDFNPVVKVTYLWKMNIIAFKEPELTFRVKVIK